VISIIINLLIIHKETTLRIKKKICKINKIKILIKLRIHPQTK